MNKDYKEFDSNPSVEFNCVVCGAVSNIPISLAIQIHGDEFCIPLDITPRIIDSKGEVKLFCSEKCKSRVISHCTACAKSFYAVKEGGMGPFGPLCSECCGSYYQCDSCGQLYQSEKAVISIEDELFCSGCAQDAIIKYFG